MLYLDPTGGESEPIIHNTMKSIGRSRLRLNEKTISSIKPLLELQNYVHSVELWSGQKTDYNFNDSRRFIHANAHMNIALAHLTQFGIPPEVLNAQWLTVDEPWTHPTKTVVVSRSARYHNFYSWWEVRHAEICKKSIFVGLPKEHEYFEYTFRCEIEYKPTPTILDLARVIAGAELFMGNQSLAMAIAIGLGIPFRQETYKHSANCVFARKDCEYF